MEGVYLEMPPNSKMFDPTFLDNSDIASLAKQQLSLSNKATSSPSLKINVNFSGLAEILQFQNSNVPNLACSPKCPSLCTLQLKISLTDICHIYKLPATI
jgi:hypothetical protein